MTDPTPVPSKPRIIARNEDGSPKPVSAEVQKAAEVLQEAVMQGERKRLRVAPDCHSPAQCAAIIAEGGEYICTKCQRHNAPVPSNADAGTPMPCPFCGKEALVEDHGEDAPQLVVSCSDNWCAAGANWTSPADWNRRAPVSPSEPAPTRGRVLERVTWIRGDDYGYLAIPVPYDTDLSCHALREKALDAALAAPPVFHTSPSSDGRQATDGEMAALICNELEAVVGLRDDGEDVFYHQLVKRAEDVVKAIRAIRPPAVPSAAGAVSEAMVEAGVKQYRAVDPLVFAASDGVRAVVYRIIEAALASRPPADGVDFDVPLVMDGSFSTRSVMAAAPSEGTTPEPTAASSFQVGKVCPHGRSIIVYCAECSSGLTALSRVSVSAAPEVSEEMVEAFSTAYRTRYYEVLDGPVASTADYEGKKAGLRAALSKLPGAGGETPNE